MVRAASSPCPVESWAQWTTPSAAALAAAVAEREKLVSCVLSVPVGLCQWDSGTWPQVTSLHAQKTEGWNYWASSINDLRFPGGSAVKNLPAVQETRVWPQNQEDPSEKEMATHSSIFAWEIPWTEEPGGLQSLGSQKGWTQLSE